MFITKTDISTLQRLSQSNNLVPIDEIPQSVREDFDLFFFGKTITTDEANRLAAYPHDIKNWVRHLFKKYAA
ncbi:hypothetical protein KZP23_16285 [Echinicola marina]|uniref:hypothetical protein n=1 Tax=Echinicola marina TaxID=2859768 RepID=UPI001CF70886|nr:hypothetical protein [Echinicola marina]UCS92252.1 hypothetical protein KZP23_16285 [Echinicola marina]